MMVFKSSLCIFFNSNPILISDLFLEPIIVQFRYNVIYDDLKIPEYWIVTR